MLNTRTHAFGNNQCAVRVSLRQNQSKFVAAKSRRGIYTAQLLAETIGQLAQCIVTGIVASRIIQMLKPIQIQHDQRQWLMRSFGHHQVFVQLHFKRTAVMATCQGIGQGLLLNLRKESGVVYRDCDLIGYGAEQKNFVFLPYARRIGRRYLQRTHQAFMKNKWRYRDGKLSKLTSASSSQSRTITS